MGNHAKRTIGRIRKANNSRTADVLHDENVWISPSGVTTEECTGERTSLNNRFLGPLRQ